MKREDYYFAAGATLKGLAFCFGLTFVVAVATGEPNKSIGPVDRAGRVAIFLLIDAVVFASGSILVATGDDIKFKKELEESDRLNASAKRAKDWGLKTPEIRGAIERSRGTGCLKDLER